MTIDVQSPFPAYAWPRVWEWIQPFKARVSDDFSPQDLDDFVAGNLALAKHSKTWAVYRDGELGGVIWIEPRTPVLVQSHVVFKRAFWGRATTEVAIRQVYSQVFDAGVGKIASFVFERNHDIVHLAKSLGARKEGLLRNHTMQNGEPVNMVALGLLREDFYASFSNGSNYRRIRTRGRTGRPKQNDDVNVDVDPELHSGTNGDPESPAVDAAGAGVESGVARSAED